ncbi:uncharacterized protein [Fopius arisanus]|uniref:Uncharacterized protein n=1 Tax=Fopius arisanus TaxID=64838 RepID=A0A9R1T8Y4_9HYME|nr:PREDICTED: uncharacterized protein LOC105267690 [Fopius arisanus]XP_011305014.1 PREDICTED: uncharacterized protein LOC105267690 [Fopius arisanus]XP_011305016.1 PREDICTED: uncharacterized protein LOC105267690 [Fopius arisanus]XP_011305017.1 PREDICTED: uncharacterized protein LOC105267690 [Fopius arisanus]XP_011305018.1 PREDICTED: uncharacterized protein LOC105267690 [Fopius arisanus]XP_011305019.1 PREDICTED: uncharacterized protein LOC105267690 [Fopius arisanus]XP_011305020.1 PREDICTED: unc
MVRCDVFKGVGIEMENDCCTPLLEENNHSDEEEAVNQLTQSLLDSSRKGGFDSNINNSENGFSESLSRSKLQNTMRSKWFRPGECIRKKIAPMKLLLSFILIFSLYFISGRYMEYDRYLPHKVYDLEDELVDGYLVWNPKCHMVSENPMDSSITKYIKKQKFEACSAGSLLTYTEKNINGSYSLVINQTVATSYKKFVCCWSTITRTPPKKPPTGEWDTKIDQGKCHDFENRVQLPADVETVMISCRRKGAAKNILYENIHPILNPAKVQSRLNSSEQLDQAQTNQTKMRRKMSILVLGIDSVSRLNFQRSLPKTMRYLIDTGWINLQGYNKIGDNTFPNLMAILTGQNMTTAYSNCKPTQAYALDNCPFLWHNFRNAGYVTAYAEDVVPLSTFNYLKVGFVEPPTDYYLRPYMIATEKLLKPKKRFNAKYCTGPELAIDRIFNYALDFAKTFIGSPYFGFFWTNTVSHEDVNGPSSMDDHFLEMFEKFEKSGVSNDTMMVFLSDHGMRWGELRNTFIGWYEERLPFIYLKLPEWMKDDPSVFQSLRINEHRLTSPYDLYETFRDILIKSGGDANVSSGCSTCQSLLKPVPIERGCADAGVSPHWCTCTAFKPANTDDDVAKEGAKAFIKHVENAIKDYKNKKGKRLCAKLRIKKIHRADKIIDLNNFSNHSITVEGYFYLIEVTPGGGKFETTIRVHGKGNYSVSDEEISRINSYAESAKCLDHGSKRFCHCIK